MDVPTMFEPYQAAADIDVIPAYFPIPIFGILPINVFVLKASQPILVDTGLIPLSDEFIEKLSSVIDLEDLRWLWLSHCDQDHIGSLFRILELAPKLKIITTFLTTGRMSLVRPLPLDRLYFLNPGQKINIGDRTLTAIRPPSYDAGETTGFYDPKSNTFFCSDCFGALMSEPKDNASEIGFDKLKEGMVTWATIDAPWLHIVDRDLFAKNIDSVRKIAPKRILSAHLPAAYNMTDTLLDNLSNVPDAQPFVAPDQQALEATLKAVTGR
jgi:flavorubredoxin